MGHGQVTDAARARWQLTPVAVYVGFGRLRPSRTVVGMLVSRSAEESQLYMDLKPCRACGERGFSWSDHYLESRASQLVSRYTGVCDSCGDQFEFEFELRRDELNPEGFGGATPSQIIDPGQFLALARAAAEMVPAEPARCEPEERENTVSTLLFAIAAIEEAAKFVPDGEDAVPPDAFVTDDSRAVYAADPLSFQSDRLQVIADSYRQVYERYLDSSV